MEKNALAVVLASTLAACGGGSSDHGSLQNANTADSAQQQVTAWVKASAAQVSTINASAQDSFSDMAAFGAAVGDARVVSLTEDSHGDANAFELMNRQVQYLHQVKGFNVLMMESSMFDVEAIWRAATDNGANVSDLAPGRVFYMYSETTAGRKVLQYVDQQRAAGTPLILMGLDVPLGGVTSVNALVPALQTFLANRGSGIPLQANWAGFANVAAQAAALSLSANPADFTAVAAQIEQETCSDPTISPQLRQTPGWWCLQVQGLAADVARQTNQNLQAAGFDPRDRQMARNVQWTLDHLYPGEKVILWSNSLHGLNIPIVCTAATCPPSATAIGSMGSILKTTTGSRLYIVKNTPMTGAVANYASPGTVGPATPLTGLLATAFHTLNFSSVFLNAPADPGLLADFANDSQGGDALGLQMDGLFVYPTAVPALRQKWVPVPLPDGSM